MAYTNVTRFLGLNSGMDTETMVTQLMNAESMKLNRHKRGIITLAWQQAAYRDVHSRLRSFQSKHLDLRVSNTLRLPSTFRTKSISIKTSAGVDSSAVSVAAGSKDGSYTVKVDQLAQSDLYESSKRFGREIASSDKFDISDIEKDAAYSITLGSTTKTIAFNEGDAIQITDDSGTKITGTLSFQEITISEEEKETRIGISIVDGENTIFTELTEEQFVEIFNDKLKTAFGMEGVSGGSQEQKIEAKLNSNDGFTLVTNGYHSTFSIKDGTANSLSGLGLEATNSTSFDTDRTLEDIFGTLPENEWSFTINGERFSYHEETNLSTLMNSINEKELGVKISFDDFSGKFRLEADKTGVSNKIEISGGFLTKTLGLEIEREASDAVATISNGDNTVTVTRESNDFELFGVDWQLKETTNGEAHRVNITRDADPIVETIKGFVESYNELINELNGLVHERRAKSEGGNYYEPLLDEERNYLTETQQEQWDEKAKQGLLNRDFILSGITSEMRTMLYQPVEMDDGSTLSLFQIGVTTSTNWRDGGALVVDENALRAAIEEHGDNIGTLFTKTSTKENMAERNAESGLAVRMNNIINSATSASGPIAQKAGLVGSSTENNNEIYNRLVKENEKINKMLDMLAKKETYYYNMFARMEAAMAKSNSQMSALMSITGAG